MPTETVVLVLTDVEGSTRLWTDFPREMNDVMARHHAIVHDAVSEHGGWRPVDQGEGDAVFAAFPSASAAVGAVLAFQRRLETEPWPDGIAVRDRVGVHVGEVTVRDGNLFGLAVARAARIRSLGAGGQVLLSAPAADLVRDALPAGVVLTDLGEHRMKDLSRPEQVWQLSGDGLASGFPPLAALERGRTDLPAQSTGFFGRESELAELSALVLRQPLTSVVGFGGMGKTRLALQVAAAVGHTFADGARFVDLAAVVDVERIPEAIASAVGGGQGVAALEPLVAWLRPRRLLLVLDNLEQLLPGAAAVVARILAEAPDVRLLVTSREAIRIRGEHAFDLEPLPVPDASATLASLGDSAAVALLLDRAAAVRHGLVLTPENAAAIAAICTRLQGLPLALELAAARLRALSPEALLPRLDSALAVLTHGSRDLPERQRTLRAAIAWSFDALPEDERTVLLRLSAFPASFPLAAAEDVAGDDEVDVLDAVAGLVERSVLRLHAGAEVGDEDRYDLLVPIREFAREQLELRHATEETAARHADWVLRFCTAGRRRIDDGDGTAIDGFRTEAASIDAALLQLLGRGDERVDDAKRLIAAARSTYLGFLPYTVLHDRIGRVPPASFRGGAIDAEVIGSALTVCAFLELQDERRAWLERGVRMCEADPDAAWSRTARLSLLLEESDLQVQAGDLDAARAVTLRCLEDAHTLGSVEVEVAALDHLVDLVQASGPPADGPLWADRYVGFVERHGLVTFAPPALLARTLALLELGRIAEAVEAWGAAEASVRTVGSPYFLSTLRVTEALIALEQGRVDDADVALSAAADHLARFPVAEREHLLLQARIGTAAARGDWTEVDRRLGALPSPSDVAYPVPPLPRTVRALLDRRPTGAGDGDGDGSADEARHDRGGRR